MTDNAPADRLHFFPEQGSPVRLVESPEPACDGMVGWKFTVQRRRQLGREVRLRADYHHTGSVILELTFFSGDARYFEAVHR